MSFLIEFLAAIPSIAYGIWGLFVLAPFLQSHVEPWIQSVLSPLPFTHWMFYDAMTVGGRTITRPVSLVGRDMFCGSLVLAIMIVPIITAISRDVLAQVPRAQVEGTVALGATWWQSCKEMLKFSRSGLFGAIMLGLARAAGETMAVTMVNRQQQPDCRVAIRSRSDDVEPARERVRRGQHRAAPGGVVRSSADPSCDEFGI